VYPSVKEGRSRAFWLRSIRRLWNHWISLRVGGIISKQSFLSMLCSEHGLGPRRGPHYWLKLGSET